LSDAARDLARVIGELDALGHRAASGNAPADVWAELRVLRARATLAFERLTGKSVGDAVGR
jgi:hypothetical protein